MKIEKKTFETLKEVTDSYFKLALDKEYPEHELMIVVDNDHTIAMMHPGWDDEGEELGDPIYLWKHQGTPEELLVYVLKEMIGLPADGA